MIEKTHMATINSEKSVSLDHLREFNDKPWVLAVKTSGSGSGGGKKNVVKRKFEYDDQNESRKRSKKEVLLSTERKSKKSASEVKSGSNSKLGKPRPSSELGKPRPSSELGKPRPSSELGKPRPNSELGKPRSNSKLGKPRSNSELGKSESREDQGLDFGGMLGGVLFCLSSSVSIPKRPRNVVRRKKVEGDVSLNQEGILNDNGVLIDVNKVNGNGDCVLLENRDVNGNLGNDGSQGTSNGSVIANGKRKKKSHDHKGSRSDSLDLLHHMKRDDQHSYLCNGNSVIKKPRKKHKKNEDNGPRVRVETKQCLDELSRICDDSQDDEENLEVNAARMLSSRFDPNCTGFSSVRNSAKHPNIRDGSNVASNNGQAKSQRARDKKKVTGRSRERRRFYAVLFEDLDSFWVLNRRIKIFWPLDKSWYIGHVIGYDREKNLHHVKYDDRDEEWIDLQHERFKLFLFPSEIPGRGGKIRPTLNSGKEDGETDELAEITTNDNSMESEPIISWLARSSLSKPPLIGVKKKKITPLETSSFQSSFQFGGKNECLEVDPSGSMVDKSLNKTNPIAENFSSNNNKAQKVYFRRQFHRKEERPSRVLEGVFKFIFPNKSLTVSGLDFLSPLRRVTSNMVEWKSHVFMLKYGTLISMWPLIHLEILFVDNVVGLRFLLFEGSMKEVVSFVFLVLAVFGQTERKEMHCDHELPVTSIRFRFSGLQLFEKQLVVTYYNFSELVNSKWSYLDEKLKKHCILAKKLEPFECTFDNITALRNGGSQLTLTNVTLKPSSVMNLTKQSRQRATNISSRRPACVKLSQLAFDRDANLGRLPSFSLSFNASPTFFLSLHLRLLIEQSISFSEFRDQNHPENEAIVLSSFPESGIAEEMTILPFHESRDFSKNENEKKLSPLHPLDVDTHDCKVGNTKGDHLNDMSIKSIHRPIVLALKASNGVCSHRYLHKRKNPNTCPSTSGNLSPVCINRKQDFFQSCFDHVPKKRRTEVSYSLPLGGQDCNFKSKLHCLGFTHKRIRKSSEKKTTAILGSCEGNILIIVGDRGWREFGARVIIELFDHNEWRLAVKIKGETKYSYKAHQFLQSGTTNRYTHAMIWKGGKDWFLEFTDRSQWTTFKEMHEDCYNRNFRTASLKIIPIPGVRQIEENDDFAPEVPFFRPSPKYHLQDETDINIAMDPTRVLYDMDSDDERWMNNRRDLDFNESGFGDVSNEMFEKIIDMLEKFAYSQQRDNFTFNDLEEVTTKIGPLEQIKIIYEYWREKRRKKGMPLIRHLQPPLWEKYQREVNEWEQAMGKGNSSLIGGSHEKPLNVEKPPMFAFCLKPRGLEIQNRGSKQRSQKKLPVDLLSNGIPSDTYAYNSLAGRRFNGVGFREDRIVFPPYNQETPDSSPSLQGLTSPRDSGPTGYFSLSNDVFERNHFPKLHRNKSKKLSSSNSDQPSPYFQRNPSKWPSEMHYRLEGYNRHNISQLSPTEIDEFRLRDMSNAARNAGIIAKMKRDIAQRMLCRADLAIHKATTAIMTSEAVKASSQDPNSDVDLSG